MGAAHFIPGRTVKSFQQPCRAGRAARNWIDGDDAELGRLYGFVEFADITGLEVRQWPGQVAIGLEGRYMAASVLGNMLLHEHAVNHTKDRIGGKARDIQLLPRTRGHSGHGI